MLGSRQKAFEAVTLFADQPLRGDDFVDMLVRIHVALGGDMAIVEVPLKTLSKGGPEVFLDAVAAYYPDLDPELLYGSITKAVLERGEFVVRDPVYDLAFVVQSGRLAFAPNTPGVVYGQLVFDRQMVTLTSNAKITDSQVIRSTLEGSGEWDASTFRQCTVLGDQKFVECGLSSINLGDKIWTWIEDSVVEELTSSGIKTAIIMSSEIKKSKIKSINDLTIALCSLDDVTIQGGAVSVDSSKLKSVRILGNVELNECEIDMLSLYPISPKEAPLVSLSNCTCRRLYTRVPTYLANTDVETLDAEDFTVQLSGTSRVPKGWKQSLAGGLYRR